MKFFAKSIRQESW